MVRRDPEIVYNCAQCRVKYAEDNEALFFMDHLEEEYCIAHWHLRQGAIDNKHPMLRKITIDETIVETLWLFAKRTLDLPEEIISEFLSEWNFIKFCYINSLEMPDHLKWTLI